LNEVWIEAPIYFITTASHLRRRVLACPQFAVALRAEFEAAPIRHGWTVGRYVIMPDHIHFFCAEGGEREPVSLSQFVGRIKQGTARHRAANSG